MSLTIGQRITDFEVPILVCVGRDILLLLLVHLIERSQRAVVSSLLMFAIKLESKLPESSVVVPSFKLLQGKSQWMYLKFIFMTTVLNRVHLMHHNDSDLAVFNHLGFIWVWFLNMKTGFLNNATKVNRIVDSVPTFC